MRLGWGDAMAKLEKRRDSDGRIRFTFRYVDVDGARRRHTPDVETEPEALRIQAEVLTRVARGIVGVPDVKSAERQQAGLTLAELHERYQAEAMPRRAKTPTAYKRQIRAGVGKLLPLFGSTALASLTRPELRRFCDSWLLEGREPATLNWVLSGLSAVWRWAQEVGLLSDSLSCPVRGLFQTPKAGSIDYLSAEQVCQLLTHAEATAPSLFPMIATAVYTGMRKGELYGLRFSDVNFTSGVIRIAWSYNTTPKSGKTRAVPIHPSLMPILRAWQRVCPQTPQSLVFPVVGKLGRLGMGNSGDGKELQRLLKESGCPVAAHPWHALRHTFASHYVMSSGNLIALQQLLGHHDISMTMVYAHLAPSYHAQDLARLTYAKPSADVIPIESRVAQRTRRK